MGLEPITFGLKGHCYTIKLCDQKIRLSRWRDLNPRPLVPKTNALPLSYTLKSGSSGIRTHGFFKAAVFKTGTINHSDILPFILILDMLGIEPKTYDLQDHCSTN